MAPISLVDVVGAMPETTDKWGPSETKDTMINGVPYAPYSKSDKLGRMADWTEGKDRDRGGRQQYGGRNYRDQQTYGANQQNPFAIQAAEEEATFSVVDNTRTSARTRGFGRGGGTIFRGRGQRGGQTQRGGRGTFQRVGGRGGQQGYDSRGGRGGRRGGRYGWRDDKPQRNRDASVNVKPDWTLLEEIDFVRLAKLNLETNEGEEIDSYGFLYYYDKAYDRNPGAKTSERKLNVLERAAYNVTTSSDPIIQDLADKDEATVFATDNILSMLMCAPRSVHSWDLVITHQGNKIFIDKREGSNLDMVTVNENAADAPLEASEGNKDTINSPSALMMEATHINNVFPIQVVIESDTQRKDMANEHPFYNPNVETDPPASKAYKYRRFDLSLERDEEPLHLIVRTELDAIMKNNISGDDQYLVIKALNEFDSKAPGSGGALDWRSNLSSRRGAVVATEMKNNSCKLARWTVQSVLANADVMRLGFVSRANPRTPNDHVILGVLPYKPRDFAAQMNLNLANGWGIVRTIVDMCLKMSEGKYVLIKDPNKSVLRLYQVPNDTFEEEGSIAGTQTIEEADGEEGGS
ncbi:eukaryotic translation initiation factor 3 subunit D [Rhizodiscina lignyota]|uniref:Eukaryotic translation initiation factor 3 subunit D n=1 Tax=Rhizodiscina lignyota TaxID=1504668 RepID=A0A9P4IAS8_9PEZI|nr:eukaryotic translation initiation factor 3 subunit D [Rhizodiscina lignyota]